MERFLWLWGCFVCTILSSGYPFVRRMSSNMFWCFMDVVSVEHLSSIRFRPILYYLRTCFNWIPLCVKQAAWDSRVQICIENCILEMPLSRQLVQIIGRTKFSIRFEKLCWISVRVNPRTRMSQNQAKSKYKDCSSGNRDSFVKGTRLSV